MTTRRIMEQGDDHGVLDYIEHASGGWYRVVTITPAWDPGAGSHHVICRTRDLSTARAALDAQDPHGELWRRP